MNTTIICLWLSIFSCIHVGHIAEYQYRLNGNELNLKFVIEKQELLNYNLNNDCDIKQMTALCTSKYLNSKSSIKINGKKITFELLNSYTKKEHLIIELSAKLDVQKIKNINIENNCFYEFNAKFKNRIIVDIGSFKKSYLLTKSKKTLILN